jgi:three prime repair exonuclease-1
MAAIMPDVSGLTGLDNYNLIGQTRFDKSTGDLLKAFLSRLPFPVCLVAHNGNLFDFPLLQAELAKAGVELGLDIFCVDSYVAIKKIFKNTMNSSLVEEAKPADRVNLEENTIEKEMQAVKILLEIGEFDKEMDAVEEVSFEHSRRIDNSKMPIGKKENEQTPLKNNIPPSSTVQIRKRKQNQSAEVFKSKKKLKFSEWEYPKSFSLINLHKHLLDYSPPISHGAEADCLALLRITAVLGEKWIVWVQNNGSPFSNTKPMWKI